MVTGGYNAVSVIDTDPTSVNFNREIARILVPQGTQDLAVSDNKLYVMNPDNMTVTIIDTATNRVVGRFTTDQSTAGRDGIYIPIDGWYPMFYVPILQPLHRGRPHRDRLRDRLRRRQVVRSDGWFAERVVRFCRSVGVAGAPAGGGC